MKLCELVSKPIQTGHTPSMKVDSFYGGKIKFIKTDNLRDNSIMHPFTHYLSEKGNAEIKRTELKEDDIITTIIGATYDVIARSCIISKEILPANINQNIAHIRPDKKKINPEYLNIYLNTRYGKMYLEYLSRQMEQVNLNCEEVGNVSVPLFSTQFQTQIERKVKSAHAFIHKSKLLYEETERILLCELNINDWKADSNPVSIKCLKESFLLSGRFDAEYYQPLYDDYEKLIYNYSNSASIIKDICQIKDIIFAPNIKQTYNYIELSNIGNNGIINECTEGVGEELPTRARRIVKEGDVIVSSIEGSLSSCAIVTNEYDGALCSTGFYVVSSSYFNPETLLMLFKSEPIQKLMKKGCSGTILTAISKSEFEKIPLPLITNDIQDQIAQKVQESFRLRRESKHLLEVAKKAVEIAISENEEKALQYIKENEFFE